MLCADTISLHRYKSSGVIESGYDKANPEVCSSGSHHMNPSITDGRCQSLQPPRSSTDSTQTLGVDCSVSCQRGDVGQGWHVIYRGGVQRRGSLRHPSRYVLDLLTRLNHGHGA